MGPEAFLAGNSCLMTNGLRRHLWVSISLLGYSKEDLMVTCDHYWSDLRRSMQRSPPVKSEMLLLCAIPGRKHTGVGIRHLTLITQ